MVGNMVRPHHTAGHAYLYICNKLIGNKVSVVLNATPYTARHAQLFIWYNIIIVTMYGIKEKEHNYECLKMKYS